MKFVLITGPHAVGKMTVGQELSKLTGLKLFHNHMTIDLVLQFFEFQDPAARRLINLFRQEIFEAVAASQLPGLIFTYMWAFDAPSDWAYVKEVTDFFERAGAEIFIVELEADYNLRLERNRTENRLAHKPTKRNLEHSEHTFKHLEDKYRLNSLPGEVKYPNYLRINNTHMAPEVCAKHIEAWLSQRMVPSSAKEVDQINQLIYDSEAYWGEGDDFMSAFKNRYSLTEAWLESHLALSVYRHGELVGFVALDIPKDDSLSNMDNRSVYLEYFYVKSTHIGTGLGRWLWEALIQYCKGHGIEHLTWITSPGAEGFYLRHGAKRIGTVQSTLRQGREIPKLTYEVPK